MHLLKAFSQFCQKVETKALTISYNISTQILTVSKDHN